MTATSFAGIVEEVAETPLGKREKGGDRNMRFLVTIDGSDMAVARSPEQFAKVVEQMVAPSIERLDQWEQEGRIHGGGYTAARGSVYIMDADSSEEVEQLLTSLPYWGLVKVDVKPLISTSSMLERARAMGQRLQEQAR
ncbi:MAG: muconolactone Delta-isomerase family protein [Actinobacteria bacterium]|nr:muconolactone Delta-isomerase family protein [Actinomycetota bacterium]MCA1738095.1 muconolactone Delta-isomerase family protein [Actinomycetota bacterium]